MISVDNLTEQHLIAGVQWISKMSESDRWNLTDEQVARLLGMEAPIYQDTKRKALNGQPVVLANAALERLSLLLGIWKGLNLFVPHERQDLAFEWFSKPTKSTTFNQKSIKDFLLESNSTESFDRVITYLRGHQYQ